MKKIIAYIVLLFLSIEFTVAQPLLKLSPNNRFLIKQDGSPFFWQGDTGWLLFINLTREEIKQYFKDRSSKGFNVVQVMVVHQMPEVNVYGNSAFVNNDMLFPKTTEGNNDKDSIAYDYWDHVDYAVGMAAQYGIYMAMVPAWGSLVKKQQLNETNVVSYVSWLANRYKDKPNIIWLNGGDIKGSVNPGVFNTIGKTLKSLDTNHLVTYHPFGRTSSSEWFSNADWLDFNMVQSGHKDYKQDTIGPDNWKMIAHDYALKPVKPVLDGEPSYEGIPHGLHDTLQPYWNAADARRYAYWSVFSGSFGHTYGDNAVMQFYKPSSAARAYGAKKYWYQALRDPGSSQMQYLQQLMLSVDFFSRVPAPEIIVNDTSTQYRRLVATKGSGYFMVYTFTGRTITVNTAILKTGLINAKWFNPKTGITTDIGAMKTAALQQFNPPGAEQEGNDWVLIVRSLPAPGKH